MIAVGCLAASLAAAAAVAAAPAPTFPEPLKPFLTAKAKDGAPILSDDDKASLAKLPERTRQLMSTAIDNQILGSASHLKTLLSLELPSSSLDLVLQDNCILCHSDPSNQKPRTLFSPNPGAAHSNPLLDLKEFVSDAHFRRGLSCSGCHGGAPTDESMVKEIAERWPNADERPKDRSWIPAFCARCHSDAGFMRSFNPSLPTDQLAKYQGSRHGILVLQEKESRAAQCVSCHGVHGIRGAKSRKSMVNPQRVPDTCGACHASAEHMAGFKMEDGSAIPTTQVAEYKASVHGKALLEKNDLGAPSCTGCHGNHAAMPPAVASVSQVCRHCHVLNGTLFDGSKHKVAFEQNKWPECARCHNKHAIVKPTDQMVGDMPGTICHDCHVKHSGADTQCDKTAAAFRSKLSELATSREEVASHEEKLARQGLDIEPLTRAVGDLDEALVQTRRQVHGFDLGTFQQTAAPGSEALGKAQQAIATAQSDHRFRRNGLLGAIGFMSLLAVGIALKLRGLDRLRKQERDDAAKK